MAEFVLPDELRHQSTETGSPSDVPGDAIDNLDAYANVAHEKVLTTFGTAINTEDGEGLLAGAWGVKSRVRGQIESVLEQSFTDAKLSADSFDGKLARLSHAGNLKENTLNAIREVSSDTDISLTCLKGAENVLDTMMQRLQGGSEIAGSVEAQRIALEEAREQQKLWGRMKRRAKSSVDTGFSSGFIEGAKEAGKAGWRGFVARPFMNTVNYVRNNKILSGGAAVGGGLLFGGLLGAAVLPLALAGGKKLTKKAIESKYDTADRYKDSLTATYEEMKERIGTLKDQQELLITQYIPVFKGVYAGLSAADKATTQALIRQELDDPSVERGTALRAVSPLFADIPHGVRLEIYKELNLGDDGDAAKVDTANTSFINISNEVNTRVASLPTGINFSNIMVRIESYGVGRAEVPSENSLVGSVLAGIPVTDSRTLRSDFISQNAKSDAEKLLLIFQYIESSPASVLRSLPHEAKAGLLAYLKDIDKMSRTDYQHLQSKEAKESQERVNTYVNWGKKVISKVETGYASATTGITTSSGGSISLKTAIDTFKFDLDGSPEGIDMVIRSFASDKPDYLHGMNAVESGVLSPQWDQVETLLGNLIAIRNKWQEREACITQKLAWERKYNKGKTPDYTIRPDKSSKEFYSATEATTRGTTKRSLAFDPRAYQIAYSEWEQAMRERPDVPALKEENWESLLTDIRITQKKYKLNTPKAGKTVRIQERMQNYLHGEAKESMNTDYFKELQKLSVNQFRLLKNVDVNTSLSDLDICEVVSGATITKDTIDHIDDNPINNTTGIEVFMQTPKAVILKATVNGENGLLVVTEPSANMQDPNVGFFAETELVGYDSNNPLPNHFDYPEHPNFVARSIALKIA